MTDDSKKHNDEDLLWQGLDASDEKQLMRAQLEDMAHKVEAYKQDGAELIEYNKDLQWTLMAMKKENDLLKDNIHYAMIGGDLKELEKMQLDNM